MKLFDPVVCVRFPGSSAEHEIPPMAGLAVLLCLIGVAPPGPEVVLNRPHPQLVASDKNFKKAIQRPLISATWYNSRLRSVLQQISESQRVAVLLDRRIDPTSKIIIDQNGQSAIAVIRMIAARVSVDVSLVGNTVCLGPPKSISKLRTLVKFRSDELFALASRLTQGRLRELSTRRTLHWNDLDRPADLIRRIAEGYKLKADGLDHVPHDLWAGSTLPAVNATEALSMVLIQFDLTFAWTDRAAGIRILPVPDEVSIQLPYTPRGMSPRQAAQLWARKIFGLHTEVNGQRVLVRGTIEQHEAVEKLLKPDRRRRPKKNVPRPTPLNRRRFSKLKFERVPAITLIQKLETTGIVFKYNVKRLAAAGIDLNQPISIDLKNALAEEVFDAMCQPLGLHYKMSGVTVILKPK